MCSSGHGHGVQEAVSTTPTGLSRRSFLTVVGAAAGGILLPTPAGAAAAVVGSGFPTARPLVLAMHVHGSWSEGLGSWEAQFSQAAANGIDVLYLTDHDSRGTAYRYLTSFRGAVWVPGQSGSLARRESTVSSGSLHLLAESANSAPAAVTLSVEPLRSAFNRLRTSIAGHRLRLAIGRCSLTGGASWQVAIELSYHPQVGSRPAGNYLLHYRFGAAAPGRHTEGGGLVGVVDAPPPASGSTVTLSPVTDVAALWPSMLAFDNCFYGLSISVTSPHAGASGDVEVTGATFDRSRSDPASVIADQSRLVTSYAPRFPGLLARPSVEVSRNLPHLNPFGVPPFIPDYALDTPTDHRAFYRHLVADVHRRGGLLSWNHPFGYAEGPLLDPAGTTVKRREVFRSLRSVGLFGADLLEVGYTLRGKVDTAAHLALWDTFSRSGTFLTGNGTSDDHSGSAWTALPNGFVTGVWAPSRSDAHLTWALAGGRAYVADLGRWPRGQMDLLVDDVAPMGSVSVSSRTSRTLAIRGVNLPTGGRVEVVGGPVDDAGRSDPGTAVLHTVTAASFVGGVHALSVNTSTSRFLRVQVRDSAGRIVGSSNPIWLLRSPPSAGIPPARRS